MVINRERILGREKRRRRKRRRRKRRRRKRRRRKRRRRIFQTENFVD